MSNDRNARDAMSETRNPRSQSRPTLEIETIRSDIDELRRVTTDLQRVTVELRRGLDDHADRLHEGDREMNTLAMDIRESSKLTREVLRVVNNLDQRVAAEQTVRRSVEQGRNIETSTPSGKIPSITFGKTRVAAPPWLFGALMTLALVLIAGVACVAVIVWLAPDTVHHPTTVQHKP